MIKCRNCQTELSETDKVCPSCGIKVKRSGCWTLAILFLLLIAGASYWVGNYKNCHLPIKYAIGNIDPRFNLSADDLKTVAKDASDRWDKAFSKDVMEYDPNASLKINLVYDNRQAEVDALIKQTSDLNLKNGDITSWSDKLDKLVADYQKDLETYNGQLSIYNSSVAFWNANGGAQEPQYSELQNQKSNLEKQKSNLDSRRSYINNLAKSLDSQAANYNSDLGQLKNYIDQNKNRIITSGLYYPNENKVDIFTFYDKDELRLVLIHELGHAFGIAHTTDPNSLMYPTTNNVNLADPIPKQADLQLVESVCRIN